MSKDRSTEELKLELASLDLEILDDEFRKRAESDHIFFCKNILGYKDLNEDLHEDVSDLVNNGPNRRKLLLLPRGHLKSSLITVGWTMWRLIQNPNRTFAIFNETQDLAEAFLREIQDQLDTPQVKKYWPKLVPPSNERRIWTKSALLVNRDKINRSPSIEAKSITESTAGRHPDVMILDDPISDRTVQTEAGLRKSLQKYRELQALLEPPSEEDPIRGTLIVIGTRWHWNDLYHHIQKNLPHLYDIRLRKAIESGKVIFPEKFSRKLLRELREEMGEWVFSSQMMNEPVDSESAIFSPTLLEKMQWKGDKRQFIERVPCQTFVAVDPAWGGNDFTGIIVGAMHENSKLYILEARRLRVKPDEMLDHIIATAQTWNAVKIGFEAVGGGQEWLMEHLRDRLDKANYQVPVIPVSHQNKSKDVRVLGLVPLLSSRRLYIHESCDDLLQELGQFPRSSYRDLMDATEMLTRIATPPGRGKTLNPRRMPGTGEYELAMVEKLQAGKRKQHGYRARWR
jgi:predicted phage terminase large subunit-like protein